VLGHEIKTYEKKKKKDGYNEFSSEKKEKFQEK